MKRQLLLLITAMTAVLAAAVLCFSPYAPPVEPVPQQIETIWAIEDTRTPSETPLVTALENRGTPLAYDAQQNRFACTLGLDHSEGWPDIHLTAPGANGVRLMFSDDYAYDDCAEAVQEGYAYQVLAYTDTQYAYFEIVFTGLPMIIIDAPETITQEDTPVQIAISEHGEEAICSPGRAHVRGDRSVTWKPKTGYKLEFTRGGGSGKTALSLNGLGETEDLLLLPISIDNTMMRDRLSWDMLSRVIPPREGFGGLPCRYAEVWISGRYQGVYLMMPPFDIPREMRKAGPSAVYSDCLYRSTRMEMVTDRQAVADPVNPEIGYELFYAPDMQHGFNALTPYLNMLTEPDDETFARMALEHIDLDSLLRYMLIMQAGAMVDNASNNLYIWAHSEAGTFRYRFAFWDMDLSWGLYAGDQGIRWIQLPIAERIISLDVGGARARAGEIWADLKARGFTAETVEALITQYVHELGDSGAYRRDAERWEKGNFYPDGYEIVAFAGTRFRMIDDWVSTLCTQP